MIQKYLDKLEFNAIIDSLLKYSDTYVGQNIICNLKPYSDCEKVRKYLTETSEAVNLINAFGTIPVSHIGNLNIALKQIESSMSISQKNLLELANVLKTARELKDFYTNSGINCENLQNYFDLLYINESIEKKIYSCFISESEVNDNASSKLASIRKNKKALILDIRNRLNSIIHSNTYSKYLMENVITIRNDRFVVPVKDEYRSQIKGFVHDTSSSGSTVYIEPMAIFEMNNSINNLSIEEEREIERILEEISSLFYPIAAFIKQNVNIIGKLDFINAKAKYSISTNSSEPLIGSYIDLKKARHPLINKDVVVPIDINIGKDFRTLVITGPNTGGKTVSLKTVGLLCMMAQAGLHIPCMPGSTIKVFDNIFADIGDEQSIQENLSTFSSHITNIVNILNSYTSESLILVDELGSGTDPIEGANLAISLLETFYNSGCFTLATTHYHEIKSYCLTHPGFENCSLEFDIKNLKPTYHLLIGIPGKSNAFAICKKIGIPDDIINRASSLISKPEMDIETLMRQTYDNKIRSDKINEEIEKNLHQVELLRKNLEKDYSDKLKNENEKIENAKKEARQILLDAKEEANSLISELSNMDDVKKANELRNKLNQKISKTTPSKGIDLSVLLELNNKDPEKLDTSISSKKDSRKSSTSKNYASGKRLNNSSLHSSVSYSNTHSSDISAEINLIGENVDSACQILDKYLDNAVLAHLHEVRIIHGKGSGKLRQGIHQYLKSSKYVNSFSLASYGEGDYGVTVVKLKI